MDLMPKVERFGSGNQGWLGSEHGTNDAHTGTLKVSAFSAFTDYIPSGVPLKKNGEGLYEPVTAAGDQLAGFLLTDQPNKGEKQIAPIMWHGRIKANKLPKNAFDVSTLTTPNPLFSIVKEV